MDGGYGLNSCSEHAQTMQIKKREKSEKQKKRAAFTPQMNQRDFLLDYKVVNTVFQKTEHVPGKESPVNQKMVLNKACLKND